MVGVRVIVEELNMNRETARQIVKENLETRKISAKMILHNDNAPAHDVLRVREFLAKNSITKMDHPPYSSDLAPCDFWLFPKLKTALKEQRFADIQRNMKTLLRGIPENDFQNCFR
jgi:transposase